MKTEDCAKAIQDDIAAVRNDGITAAELDKARIQFLRQQIQARQSDLRTALQLGQYTVYFDDPNLINTIVDKFDAVTADQVKEAALKYLVPEQLTVLTDLPAAPKGKAAQAQKEGK